MQDCIIYGKRRKVYGVRMADGGDTLRLVLDGGAAYLYGVPRESGEPVRLVEVPAMADEGPNGDVVTYADGHAYRVGGALAPASPDDLEFAAAIRAESEPPKTARKGNGGAGGREPKDDPEETAKAVRWVKQHAEGLGTKRACELAVSRYGLTVGWQALRRRVVPDNSPRK